MTNDRPPIRLTRSDIEQLENLLNGPHSVSETKAAASLRQKLSNATVVDPEVSRGAVTMHAIAFIRDEGVGEERVITLVYPTERRFADAAISVLTPLGAALIGVSEGQSVTFEDFDGCSKRVTVLRVLYQPTAQGR